MKKFYALITTLVLLSAQSFAQDVAMDFTRTSCNGTEHHLFDDLEDGNVVVLEFVMLNCAPCIVATNALKTLTAPYETTHPGRVRIYTFAYLDLYTCDQIMAWANVNSFSQEVFSMGEEQVTYYGGMGMPTIVILGNNSHKVYYKTAGYVPSLDTQITGAIDLALSESTLGLEEGIRDLNFKVYPSLFTDKLILESGVLEGEYTAEIYNSVGHKIQSLTVNTNERVTLTTSDYAAGIYFLRLRPLTANTSVIGGSKTFKLVKR